MKMKLMMIPVFGLCMAATPAFAGPPTDDDNGARQRGTDRAAQREDEDRPRRPGPRGDRGPRFGGPGDRDMPPGPPRPEQLVRMFMQRFDEDGDDKLNAEELTALITTMRQRGGFGPRRPGGPDGPGFGPRGPRGPRGPEAPSFGPRGPRDRDANAEGRRPRSPRDGNEPRRMRRGDGQREHEPDGDRPRRSRRPGADSDTPKVEAEVEAAEATEAADDSDDV